MGRFDIRIVAARNVPNTEWFGLPDPRVKLEVINDRGPRQTFQTSVKPDTLAPEWNELFKLTIADDNAAQLKLTLTNVNTVSDDDLGEYKLACSGFVKGYVIDKWILLQNCKTSCEIHVRILAHDFGRPMTKAEQDEQMKAYSHQPANYFQQRPVGPPPPQQQQRPPMPVHQQQQHRPPHPHPQQQFYPQPQPQAFFPHQPAHHGYAAPASPGFVSGYPGFPPQQHPAAPGRSPVAATSPSQYPRQGVPFGTVGALGLVASAFSTGYPKDSPKCTSAGANNNNNNVKKNLTRQPSARKASVAAPAGYPTPAHGYGSPVMATAPGGNSSPVNPFANNPYGISAGSGYGYPVQGSLASSKKKTFSTGYPG